MKTTPQQPLNSRVRGRFQGKYVDQAVGAAGVQGPKPPISGIPGARTHSLTTAVGRPVRRVDYGLVQAIALGAADPLPVATNPKVVEPLPAIVAL